ncbi:MAG TPA: hypothetical protein VEQ87_00430 [Burkholderiales bacterium]|nr:hypothetical protein [Burkholderiales bacterium]
MKYAISADAELLHVTFSGREDDEPPSEVCEFVFRESRRLGRNRILIELDQKAALSPASQVMLVNRLPQIGFTPADRIALVHRTGEMQQANQFINTAAANRGVMVRNFPGVQDAKAWLREP